MPLYALDTDTVSLFRDGHPRVVARVAAQPPADVRITAITVDEQVDGWLKYIRQATRPDGIERGYAELVKSVKALAKYPVLPYTPAAIAGYEALLKQKLNVDKNDLRIAAIALEFGAIVVTHNVRDFRRVPNLLIEDWSV
ncbi:MAG: type II toxin-antitoxin system VapC family toxin [Gemmataceae bacterium]|nr:type II toxin-antitoxin system VapC family toxin [Gemmataceae bacterium]